MVYHSVWNGYEEKALLGCGVYQIKQSSARSAGPAPRMEPKVTREDGTVEDAEDVIDEALQYFKPNMLFRTYTIKGAGDRLILYLTAFINTCLKRLVGVTKQQAAAVLFQLANESFVVPGDKAFAFSSFFPPPADAAEVEQWREYVRQLRIEVGERLVRKVYLFPEADGTGNKFWMVFAKMTLLGQADK